MYLTFSIFYDIYNLTYTLDSELSIQTRITVIFFKCNIYKDYQFQVAKHYNFGSWMGHCFGSSWFLTLPTSQRHTCSVNCSLASCSFLVTWLSDSTLARRSWDEWRPLWVLWLLWWCFLCFLRDDNSWLSDSSALLFLLSFFSSRFFSLQQQLTCNYTPKNSRACSQITTK